jgi:hypothetical protein
MFRARDAHEQQLRLLQQLSFFLQNRNLLTVINSNPKQSTVNMAFSLALIKQRTARHQAAHRSNIRTRFYPVAERRSILRTAGHEPAEQHANNRVEFSKERRTHVFVTEEAAQQRSHTFRGVCTKLPVSTLQMPPILRSGSREPQANNRVEFCKEFSTHVFVTEKAAQQRSQIFRGECTKLPVSTLQMPSILRSGSREPQVNNRVEFCQEFSTHVFVTEEAPKQRSQTFRGECTKLPVSTLQMPSILRSGSRQPQANNRVEFRREFLKHVFVKGLPAKQRSKTFRVHVCPSAPPRKKRTANMLEHHRSELASCNLATLFEGLQVEEEVLMEETYRVEEVVGFVPQEEEVEFNDVGHVPTDPVVLRSRRTSLQREAAALSCDLGTYWSEASPRRLRRSTRARKRPDRFIPSF